MQGEHIHLKCTKQWGENSGFSHNTLPTGKKEREKQSHQDTLKNYSLNTHTTMTTNATAHMDAAAAKLTQPFF